MRPAGRWVERHLNNLSKNPSSVLTSATTLLRCQHMRNHSQFLYYRVDDGCGLHSVSLAARTSRGDKQVATRVSGSKRTTGSSDVSFFPG